ncbi:MAG TPA: hypothetical protein VMW50_11185, partial [Dehalococcoidia bacterium]|nr:hypothetical protein [Dehalococcoidia bacterium]
SNKVNNYEHHVALKPADGEQRHVAGNKVYPSAEHAIKAANAEHAKSGLILGVEKYDPQKHPTALPARGKGSAAHAANEKEKAFQKQWPNGGTVARKDGGYPRGAGSEKQGKENHSALRNKVAANRGAEAAAEFEGPVKADPAKERLMSKGKRDDDEKAAAQRHELNKPASSGKNGYVGFYKGKRAEVHADTSYEAQQKLAKMLGAKKAHEVSFGLAEKDGQQVTHTAVDAQPGMVTQQNSGGPAWKGKNLDDNPVGDSYGSGDCAASPDAAAWPGRVL